jgi:hypothetical protein
MRTVIPVFISQSPLYGKLQLEFGSGKELIVVDHGA